MRVAAGYFLAMAVALPLGFLIGMSPLMNRALDPFIQVLKPVFMITHDVDEAIYLADKIVLMTNGPNACIAEIVVNPLPRQRSRNDVHRHPAYYPLRNHIVDFLVSRSMRFAEETAGKSYDPRHPPIVNPAIPEPSIISEYSALDGSAEPTVLGLDGMGAAVGGIHSFSSTTRMRGKT